MMAEGETAVLSRDPGAAVLRISLPMGPSFNGHAGAIDWIQSRFRAGRPATLYYDEVRSATYCDDLNRVFAYFLGSADAGVYHLGGPACADAQPDRANRQQGGRLRGFAAARLLAPRGRPHPAVRGNVSMNSDKLIALLGGNPFHGWPLHEELLPTDGEWHHRRPAGWRGSPAFLEEQLYRNPRFSSHLGHGDG